MRPNKNPLEDLRLAYYHLYLSAEHLKHYYNSVKPPEVPPIDSDPNQLELFHQDYPYEEE